MISLKGTIQLRSHAWVSIYSNYSMDPVEEALLRTRRHLAVVESLSLRHAAFRSWHSA